MAGGGTPSTAVQPTGTQDTTPSTTGGVFGNVGNALNNTAPQTSPPGMVHVGPVHAGPNAGAPEYGYDPNNPPFTGPGLGGVGPSAPINSLPPNTFNLDKGNSSFGGSPLNQPQPRRRGGFNIGDRTGPSRSWRGRGPLDVARPDQVNEADDAMETPEGTPLQGGMPPQPQPTMGVGPFGNSLPMGPNGGYPVYGGGYGPFGNFGGGYGPFGNFGRGYGPFGNFGGGYGPFGNFGGGYRGNFGRGYSRPYQNPMPGPIFEGTAPKGDTSGRYGIPSLPTAMPLTPRGPASGRGK